jgi:hypothetical protein
MDCFASLAMTEAFLVARRQFGRICFTLRRDAVAA